MSIVIRRKRREVKIVHICKDCKTVINNKKKGMYCVNCGQKICYKCNISYKCKDCYIGDRDDYYINDLVD